MNAPPAGTTLEHLDLELTGMTCAACANRIEKKLNRLDGVTATVNYATEKANVAFDPEVATPETLIATVQSIGYGAAMPAPIGDDRADPALARIADLRRRLTVAVLLGVPVLLLSMIPALQFRGWQWFALVFATPVAAWSAWPFPVTAWKNLRQAEASMDTLVSVGVIAAYGWCPTAARRITCTWKWPAPPLRSSSPVAGSKRVPSAARAVHCARCWRWAPTPPMCCRQTAAS